ncbi:MAG: amidase [Pseudomonadota bacterium]
MAELSELGASEAAKRIADGDITSEALVQSCLDRISAQDDAVRAWIYLQPEYALDQARAADVQRAKGFGTGPLHGVPIGVKDIIETADMPTQNGYKGHLGRHTHKDALCVSQMRDAGAVVVGKTVTTELAVRMPGKTRNPHDPARTPGGSSSGSAAAVADRQVPLAFGTQTAGSVIRPGSYCGIVALKPTFGLIARQGVTQMAAWLDTVGCYGRSVEDVALMAEQLMLRDQADPQSIPRSRSALHRMALSEPPGRPRLAFMRGAKWDQADAAAQGALEAFAQDLGSECEAIDMPAWMADAWDWQAVVMRYSIAQNYGPLMDLHGDLMSESLRGIVADGRATSEADYRQALDQRDALSAGLDEIYARFDAILCLPAPGAAPKGLDWTGEPVFNTFWTYAGTPCVSLPLLQADGMPLGVQLTGPRGGDGALLRTANWLMTRAAT